MAEALVVALDASLASPLAGTAALEALVRGNSSQPGLHLLAETIQCYVLAESLVYFEWTVIKAGWAKKFNAKGWRPLAAQMHLPVRL